VSTALILTVVGRSDARYRRIVSSAYAWTVYATMLTLLLAVITILFNLVTRVEARLESRIDSLDTGLRGELRDMRAELREGFAQLDNRLRLLERDRS
jgi:hypothetical protein